MVTGGSQEKPLPLKLIFFKHASFAQADIKWFFLLPPFFSLPNAICAAVFLYDNFERKQCGTKPSLFPLIQ